MTKKVRKLCRNCKWYEAWGKKNQCGLFALRTTPAKRACNEYESDSVPEQVVQDEALAKGGPTA